MAGMWKYMITIYEHAGESDKKRIGGSLTE
jgi:hypothetical protein